MYAPLTHARPASSTDPAVQKTDTPMSQKPRSAGGTNSMKRENTTGAPPSPTPTSARVARRAGKDGAAALATPANTVSTAVMANPTLRRMRRQMWKNNSTVHVYNTVVYILVGSE